MDERFHAAIRRLHQVEELLEVVDPEVEDVVQAEYQAAMAHVRACLWRLGHPRVDHVTFPWQVAVARPRRFLVLHRRGAA